MGETRTRSVGSVWDTFPVPVVAVTQSVDEQRQMLAERRAHRLAGVASVSGPDVATRLRNWESRVAAWSGAAGKVSFDREYQALGWGLLSRGAGGGYPIIMACAWCMTLVKRAMGLAATQRITRRLLEWRCPACGYDLRAHRADPGGVIACPECGDEYPLVPPGR